MSKRKPLSVLIASLFLAGPAAAQGVNWMDPITGYLPNTWITEGNILVGPIFSSIDSQDKSKLIQYRDLEDGALSNIELRGRNAAGSWYDFYGENFGRQDMYMSLRGGQYDAWKGRLYWDWIPQNRQIGYRTPYFGVGGPNLTGTFPSLNPDGWPQYNVGYVRKDLGGFFEWQRNSPWYFRVDANQVNTEGTKIGAAANGTSPGNGFVDLAFPVDYTTTNTSIEAGYSTSKYLFTISYLWSKFDNSNSTVSWTNPYFGNRIDSSYLPPDNDYQRLALNGTIRQLPWNSTLAGRVTWDKLDNSTTLATTTLNTGGVFAPTYPQESTFDGKVENLTASLNWTAAPSKQWDTRLYTNYYDRSNKSTVVDFGNTGNQVLPSGVGCGTATVNGANVVQPCENEPYDYTKWNFGGEAYWKFAQGNRLTFGAEYMKTEQNRPDYDEYDDTKLYVEYRNTMLPNLTGKIRYLYWQRDSNFLLGEDGTGPNDPLYLERFIGRYDGGSFDRNVVDVQFDWAPMPLMDVTLEYLWKDTKYKRDGQEINFLGSATPFPQDDFLGRNRDKRWELYGSLGYGDRASVRGLLFGTLEKIQYDSYHRNISTVAGGPTPPSGYCTAAAPNCFDPGTVPTSSNYNWSAVNKDTNWSVGAGVDWQAMSNLLVKASALYYKTDGNADITSTNNYGNPFPINAYDDTEKTSFNLKAIWDYNKNWQFTAGYAYEKYNYTDDQYYGYKYTIPFPAVANNTSQSYLSGFNAFTDYKANIFYILFNYKFDKIPAAAPVPAAPVPVAAPAPPPKPAPAAAPAPAPKPPAAPMDAPVQKITLQSKALFDFDKAVLKPEGQKALDTEVIAKMSQVSKLELVLVSGHTDRIGSDAYNQKLSERRADAVRDYLVSKGVPKAKIEAIGLGEKQPVTGTSCNQKNQKELIACLQPDRRVEVEVKGETVKK